VTAFQVTDTVQSSVLSSIYIYIYIYLKHKLRVNCRIQVFFIVNAVLLGYELLAFQL